MRGPEVVPEEIRFWRFVVRGDADACCDRELVAAYSRAYKKRQENCTGVTEPA